MQRIHEMPFGAAVQDDGRVRFRLWAPGARRVDLVLEGPAPEATLPLTAMQAGWYELVTPPAAPGTRYRFRIDGRQCVPDPASRRQPADVHGPSQVVEPRAFAWRDAEWTGRPWEEVVLYELHVGTYTPEGDFDGVRARLEHLAQLGVTALELMPVADFPGARNWGYDGVLPFAPDGRYGTPEQLKALVQAAHAHGLMVFLDVVYNHFGPEGNYLGAYAPQFFNPRHHTPWGAALNFDGPKREEVRRFFVHNALYWLEEYHLDGLRLDAVHAILDESDPDFLTELAQAVRRGPGASRHVHLVLENDHNAARYLARDGGRPRAYDAQWNDDLHHALHVLLTGERHGYYQDYGPEPAAHLARCLAEGFAYQGEPSAFRGGAPRGEASAHLPPAAFVAFLQNHDQVGNRAYGERITALAPHAGVRAATVLLLLAPFPPLLFMGQEWGAPEPFPFFCDFGAPFAAAVTEGRRREFAHVPGFEDPAARARIPDPQAVESYARARLDWDRLAHPEAREWLRLHRTLLELRRREIVPRLAGMGGGARARRYGARALGVEWTLADGARLTLLANLGADAAPAAVRPAGRCLYATHTGLGETPALPPWCAGWFLREARGGA